MRAAGSTAGSAATGLGLRVGVGNMGLVNDEGDEGKKAQMQLLRQDKT